jgi:hypothetical protein
MFQLHFSFQIAGPEIFTNKKIEEHGGIVVNTYEPYVYQIKIEGNKVPSKIFYSGVIYSSKLIDKSIEHGKMIKNASNFNIGTIENGIPHKSLFRQTYTFIEVMKMFDIAKQNKYSKKLYKSPAWVKIEDKQVLPGRTASSLAGTYRKFDKMGRDEALKSILKRGRYSLYFQYAPEFSKEASNDNTPSTQVSPHTNKENLSPLRANFLSDEDEVQNEEDQPSDGDEMQEFLLAVDDLESVLSYRGSNDRTYNLQTNMKKVNARNL